MRIAVLASEGAPYAKSGGLGDVMEALPSALARIPGNEVVLILPYYQKLRNNSAFPVEFVTQATVSLGWRKQYAGVLRLKKPGYSGLFCFLYCSFISLRRARLIVPSCMVEIHCRLLPQPLATPESASSAMEQAISVRSEMSLSKP